MFFHQKNSRMLLERDMRFILRYISIHEDLPPLDDKTTYALKACYDAKYVEGVHADVMASGRIVFEVVYPKVNLAGLRFAYPYKDWKFILPTSIAFAEFAEIVIQIILQII